ncbi:DUF4115 domain-containing protein [Virgibacillus sp. C22-A2]|uniref:DUF4115 domain-containing protein n=1 Tax=Virgibacillus tibetensis TaxID=3042313 RepID=A0ABU6KBI4_9BACI|nr:DUF4115 domain-containing protein [Virgibacillus sp. C22-A2]
MEIGARLKEAREAKGISLDTLQETTKIQKRYLTAIEEGNFHILPGKFYARAFIKEYANAVGLDSNELLEEYKEDVPNTENESEVEYTRIQRTRREGNPEKSSAIFSLIPTIIVVLLIIGIIFAAWFFIQQTMSDNGTNTQDDNNDNEVIINNPEDNGDAENEENDEGTDNTDETETEESAEEEGGQSEPELTLNEDETDGATTTFDLNNAGDDVTVTLEATGDSWVEIQGEDQRYYYNMLTEAASPEEFDVSDEGRIYLNIGNASVTVVTINGVELDYPIDPNENVTQKFWININKETE